MLKNFWTIFVLRGVIVSSIRPISLPLQALHAISQMLCDELKIYPNQGEWLCGEKQN
jgi:hypothetical protein